MPSRGTLASLLAVAIVLTGPAARGTEGEFPWRKVGLTEEEAADHLLRRFTFGPRPGDVERVVEEGMEGWFADQLGGDLPDPELEEALAPLDTLGLSAAEMARTFPSGGVVLTHARMKGIVSEPDEGGEPSAGLRRSRADLRAFAEEEGYRRQGELLGDLLTQRIVRAVGARNQLHEILVDFWFDHFTVSLVDPEARVWVPAYERDAIRPHVTGSFRELLGATARHPAMLLYLDNARSVADPSAATTFDRDEARRRFDRSRLGERRGSGAGGRSRFGRDRGMPGSGSGTDDPRRPDGINENYARELLELHTLGVDGGYTQEDVEEVARAFTGWTVVPPGPDRDRIESRLRRVRRHGWRVGFVTDGAFLFRADAHDAGEKTVLGRRLPPGRGIDDGEDVLDLLAAHRSTARHVAEKLAVRFVSDDPPSSVIERLAAVFSATDGDLEAVVAAIPASEEFWRPEVRNAKIKSPFELVVSSLRALDAEVGDPAALVDWIDRIGQPLYRAPSPAGFPDRADHWVTTAGLLARMSFGLELGTGGVPGVTIDLPGLLPGSTGEALDAMSAVLLPADAAASVAERLLPLAGDPALAEEMVSRWEAPSLAETGMFPGLRPWEDPFPHYRRDRAHVSDDASAVARVAGLVLGSPEFQRR